MCDDLGLHALSQLPEPEQRAEDSNSCAASNLNEVPRDRCSAQGEGCSSSCNNGLSSSAVSRCLEGMGTTTVCVKCKTRMSRVHLLKNESVCADCLVENVRAKFRYALKSKGVIKAGDRVLVPTSGDYLSHVLLELLLVHRNPDSGKPKRGQVEFYLEVVWVDEACLDSSGRGEGGEEMIRESVQDLTTKFEAGDVVFTRLMLQDVVGCSSNTSEDKEMKLTNLVGGVGDSTGREDLISHLKKRVIVSYAESKSFNKIALPDSKTSLGTHIIGSTAKARGYDLPGDLHFIDARLGYDKPIFIRPLRDLVNKELGLYCHFCNIETCTVGSSRNLENERPSLNDVAEKFILSLQNAFPSGLSSILSTGSKLQAFEWNKAPSASVKEEQAVTPPLCKICIAPLSHFLHHDQDVGQLDSFWKENFCFSCCSQIILKFHHPSSNVSDPPSLAILRSAVEELCPI